MAAGPEIPRVVEKASELLFFDNLALFYLVERIPPPVLARAFTVGDPRLAGAILGILNMKQRQAIHALMAVEKDDDEVKNAQAAEALVITANDLYARGLIRKQGRHYYGTPREEKLQAR